MNRAAPILPDLSFKRTGETVAGLAVEAI